MEAASDIMASEVILVLVMEDGWVVGSSRNSLLLVVVLGGVVVLDDVGNNDVVGGSAISGGSRACSCSGWNISTSSTKEAREKDSFSETVAPADDEKVKYIFKK